MLIDSTTLVAILGMALVTYATRIAGLWLMNRVTLSDRMTSWLRQIPGAVLISIVAPTVLTQGIAECLAALATMLVAIRTGSLVLAMVTGIGTVWILRTLLLGAS